MSSAALPAGMAAWLLAGWAVAIATAQPVGLPASYRDAGMAIDLPAGWAVLPPGPGALRHLVARFRGPVGSREVTPVGRLYRVPGAPGPDAVLAATAGEAPDAFGPGPRPPARRVEAMAIDGATGRTSWLIRHEVPGSDPRRSAYVRRDVLVVHGAAGYRLVLELRFDGDEHVAHAFGIEAHAVVASWRWLR